MDGNRGEKEGEEKRGEERRGVEERGRRGGGRRGRRKEAVNRRSEWHAWTAPLSLKDAAAAACTR